MQHHSPQRRPAALHLILGGRSTEAASVDLTEKAARDQAPRELRAEAIEIEAWYGANAYSRYLTTHGRRPDPVTAATIGRLIGAQVKAADGTMQPRLSKAERLAISQAKTRRKAHFKQQEELEEFARAVLTLATVKPEPLVQAGDCPTA